MLWRTLMMVALVGAGCGDKDDSDVTEPTETTDTTTDLTDSGTATDSGATDDTGTTDSGATDDTGATGVTDDTSATDDTGGTDDTSTSEPECDSTEAECDGECVDLTLDPANCGECDNVCGDDQECLDAECLDECLPTEDRCEGECSDLQTDEANCGECGSVCDGVCEGGECTVSCAEGETLCGGECVDLSSDAAHCGACDNTCDTADECVFSTCALPCTGNADCDSGEFCTQVALFDKDALATGWVTTSVTDATCATASPNMYCGDPLSCSSGGDGWTANFCDGFISTDACQLHQLGYIELGYFITSMYK